ncbi:MAG: squalene/phytoene synthase family protein [Pirellulaceae bacterium]|nr:squalene/phytoene synthase family protein [Pirellulaceae bacterium]
MMKRSLQASYRRCRRVASRASSNFYWTFHRLPAEKRRAMWALYAFSRHTDDLGDSELPAERRAEQLEHWQAELESALSGNVQHPWLPAVVDAVERFSMPVDCLRDLIRGVKMDLQPPEYETLEELTEYCRCVASSVGLACIHIWGFDDPAVREPAIRCGLAFQMTNILRDLSEDARRQRCYLPREDLRRFQVQPSDLRDGPLDERLAGLMRYEMERTEQLYRESYEVIRYLSADGRRIFAMMFATYLELLREIERRKGDVFRGRVRLPWRRKLSIAARYALPWPMGDNWPRGRNDIERTSRAGSQQS